MAPAVLPGPPVPLLTVSCARNESGNSKSKEKAESKAVPTKVGSYQKHGAASACTRARVNVSRGGGHGRAGPLAPWMAPSSPHGWVYGVSCTAMPSASPRIRKALLLISGSCFEKRAGGLQARQRKNSSGHDVLLQVIQLPPLCVDHRFDQVTDGDHAQHRPTLHHRQMADAVVGHQLQAVFHLLAR